MLYPLSYGGSVPWERVPVNGLSLDTQPQSTPSPARRRYPHGRDARIGTGARRRRRRGDQATDRGEPPAGGLRRGDGGGRPGLPGEGVRDRSGRHHAGRDDAAARRLGDSGPAAQIPGDRAHQGGADHRPRPGGRQEPRQPGGRRRLPDQAVRPERDDPRGPRAGQRRSAELAPLLPGPPPGCGARSARTTRSSGRARRRAATRPACRSGSAPTPGPPPRPSPPGSASSCGSRPPRSPAPASSPSPSPTPPWPGWRSGSPTPARPAPRATR